MYSCSNREGRSVDYACDRYMQSMTAGLHPAAGMPVTPVVIVCGATCSLVAVSAARREMA